MSFILGSVLIGAGATIAGAAISSGGAKDAAETSAAGSDREIEFNRESRDLARADQAPYREAGYTALDALMSLTGLGGPQGGPKAAAPSRPRRGGEPVFYPNGAGGPDMSSRLWDSGYYDRPSSINPFDFLDAGDWEGRVNGGAMYPNTIYNVSELSPENVYSGGAVTRNPNPVTIDGETGYVEPNIQGRQEGGMIGGAYDPRIRVPPQRRDTAINPGYPTENPGGVEGGYNFMTDPGYGFRRDEGARVVERSAAARGGLLSGGTAKALTRYGQGFASNEFGNVYNRIANIAGLGQVGATQSGNAALYGGARMGNAASEGANATAYGEINAGNAWANAGNQIAQMPWDRIFGEP